MEYGDGRVSSFRLMSNLKKTQQSSFLFCIIIVELDNNNINCHCYLSYLHWPVFVRETHLKEENTLRIQP